MTWHTVTVAATELASLLDKIRNAGGTVASSTPADEGIRVTWTVTGPRLR